MIFKTLGLGKANLLSGFGSEIMMKVMDQMDFSEDTFNEVFEKKTFHLKLILLISPYR
jgi:hypothetical protein